MAQTSTVTIGNDGEERAAGMWLVVMASPDSNSAPGKRLALDRSFALGRDPGRGGVKLADNAVSRKHVGITWHDKQGMAELKDLDSKNGTFVNALRTVRRFLEPDDVVRIGEIIFVVDDQEDSGETLDPLPALVGRSRGIWAVKELLVRIAPGALPVLVLGETGCGKEVVAQSLHGVSGRTGRFVPVNCSAIPENLFESTFFGHKKGAFTGSAGDSAGLLRQADGGTLFLDEVGELALPAQAKLLRFLEDGLVRGVGESREVKVAVRVVAATNADLQNLQEAGRFRADLLARLEGFAVDLPPLRERRLDIPLLLEHFLGEHDMGDVEITVDALEALLAWRWQRNVRGLRTVILRWLETADRSGPQARCFGIEDLSDAMARPVRKRVAAPVPAPLEADDRPSRTELMEVLEAHDHGVPRTAAYFGKHRKQVYRWLQRYGIELPER